MSNLVLYTLVSLDGATEDPHRYVPETPDRPGAPVFDEELVRFETEMIARRVIAVPSWPSAGRAPRPGWGARRSDGREAGSGCA